MYGCSVDILSDLGDYSDACMVAAEPGCGADLGIRSAQDSWHHNDSVRQVVRKTDSLVS